MNYCYRRAQSLIATVNRKEVHDMKLRVSNVKEQIAPTKFMNGMTVPAVSIAHSNGAKLI